ncbi:DUF72 domain-containing protein, partial [Candidatus Bathyarchaeota archaeon]|nr:DUF72 domain-containing protein [Candidatus Bathyarchaeota archaeon]
MVRILIGSGGWGYFKVPRDRLRNYARAFNTVEVNSTFYSIPPLSLAENWRKRVPEAFEFTVRCPRELSYRLQFNPLSSSLELFDHMKQIANVGVHRGYFAKMYPDTSRRIFYFLPSIVVMILLFGLILSAFS